ncbi:hypothetical protein X772_34460 [Mesorhizobium sp. LSJC280B00]|nr:hypothetical protein X772_34460 [Mesorhizobium sp. LSJC280B00]
MAIIDVAAAVDDDIGTRLEQVHHFSPARTRRSVWAMICDLLNQRPVMADLGLPQFNGPPRMKGGNGGGPPEMLSVPAQSTNMIAAAASARSRLG